MYLADESFQACSLFGEKDNIIGVKEKDKRYAEQTRQIPIDLVQICLKFTKCASQIARETWAILVQRQCRKWLPHVYHPWFVLMHKLWYMWLSWLVVCKTRHLSRWRASKVCSIEPCQKLVWNQQSKNRHNNPPKKILGLHFVCMWSVVDGHVLKHPFAFAFNTIANEQRNLRMSTLLILSLWNSYFISIPTWIMSSTSILCTPSSLRGDILGITSR